MFSDEPSKGISLFTNNASQAEEMSRLIPNKHTAMFGSDLRRAFPQPPSNKSTPQKSSVVQPASTQSEPLPVPIIQPSVNVNNGAQENTQPEKVEVALKEDRLHQKTVHSKPGGYSYEMNKLLFMSSFIELLRDHNIVAPEEVFENTDITQKLFEFFKEYGISPSEKAIPRFQVTKNLLVSGNRSTNDIQAQNMETSTSEVDKRQQFERELHAMLQRTIQRIPLTPKFPENFIGDWLSELANQAKDERGHTPTLIIEKQFDNVSIEEK